MKQRWQEFWLRVKVAAAVLRRGLIALESLAPEERRAPWKTREDLARLLADLQKAAGQHFTDSDLDWVAFRSVTNVCRDVSVDVQAARHFIAAFEQSNEAVKSLPVPPLDA